MEATGANMFSECVNSGAPLGPGKQLTKKSDRGLLAAYPQCKKPDNPSGEKFQDFVKQPEHPSVQAPDPPVVPGVSDCYVFKSRLQEYAQKVALSAPTYETVREGPSHLPLFQSSVIFGGVRYESLPGFFSRKAAEQSAAEIALMDLSSKEREKSFFVPVHETSLCKNVLQEYAQKMNYAIPTYTCNWDGSAGRTALYSCTVEIGGIQYIGAVSRNKKDAEVKAARTALLAIRSTGNVGSNLGKNNLTVLPSKRKAPEQQPPKTSKPKKSMKARFKRKPFKRIRSGVPSNGNETQPCEKAVCVDNNKGTPVTDPTVDKANNGQSIDKANNGQSDHCLESDSRI